ncbi:MAG: Wadjet anti-phage system protein JetD domain-containing protein [Oliverpabstia sp.]
MRYENRILQKLLDSYENSSLSRGENTVAVHIAFAITPKTMPMYFDESSLVYEEIHAAVRHLEELGYVRPVWKGKRENHILQKIILCDEKAEEAYRYVNRIPKMLQQNMQLGILEHLAEECQTPAASAFISWLMERLRQGKTVKEYLNLEDTEETKRLIRAVSSIEQNQEEVYIREFSIRCFGDSKMLEKRLGLIGKIMRRFSENYEGMDSDTILAEHGIYHTPNYVYMKGRGCLCIGYPKQCKVDLGNLRQGIGLSGEDLDTLQWLRDVPVEKVITIENLTTFFRWEEKDSVLIYLGGYHNGVRRKFLQKLYRAFPEAAYFHFGDIDVGGFEIYRDLCRRTGIPFRPYHMGIHELKQYEPYTKKLTENDRKRLDELLEREEYSDVRPVLKYIKEHGEKLEQECLQCKTSESIDFGGK